MTLLQIDLSDVAGGTHPDDKVVVWSPVHREGSAGRTVSPTQHTIRLTDGQGELEVEPGPLMVQTHVRAIADTRPKEVVVPDQATVTLWDLLEQVFQWTPPLVNRALQAIMEALEGALESVDAAVAASIEQMIQDALEGKVSVADLEARLEELIGTAPENLDTLGEIATELADQDSAVAAIIAQLAGKAAKADVDSADRALSDQITALETLIGASKAKAGQVPKWDGHQFGWSWMDQHTDLYDDSY